MRPRVLVVHAGGDQFEGVCAMLESRGLGVEEAEGSRALDSLDSHRPDVILLSVGGAAANGMEILDRIRANPQHTGIPVILMGTEADDEDLLEGYKFGADYYLTQPFSTRHMLYALGLVLGREFPE